MFHNYSVLIILTANFCIPISGNSTKTSSISDKLPEHGKDWQYGQNWASLGYGDCGKSHQSPITISSNSAIINDSLNFELQNYDKPVRSAFIENNGHTGYQIMDSKPNIQISFSDQLIISINGSVTDNERYVFEQLHFHWGSYDGWGSEHRINRIRYSMEIHLVHYKQSYGSFDEAVDKPDGLLVLGGFYRISSRNNKFLSSVIKLVKDVPKYKDKVMLLEAFTLRSLLPRYLKPFYVYSGSLTTPPCYESVKWIVFDTPIDISDAQEKQFRKCHGEHQSYKTRRMKSLSNNFRPIQKLNDREVQMCT